MSGKRAGAIAALLLLLSACATRPAPTTEPPPLPAPVPPPPPPLLPDNALAAGLTPAEPRPVPAEQAERALAAFRLSCPVLLQRGDQSGLTRPADWIDSCSGAASVPAGAAADFFRDRFEWVRVGPGEAFATGYYEPEIAASRTPSPAYPVPIYAKPPDLVRGLRVDGKVGRGRAVDPPGSLLLPYYTRTEIENGALAGRGLEVAWAADAIDLFFLQVQGSGRLKLADGGMMRIGYADQNGHEYVSIGRLLRERQLLPPGGAGMAPIINWMRAQPDGGQALMRENPSYVFFREIVGPGPPGSLGVAVTARASVAADPRFVPLGAPVWLELDRPEASGLWVAQDTGGAIKGPNRFDTFWGGGAYAEWMAGHLQAKGSALLLLPRGTVARAQAQ